MRTGIFVWQCCLDVIISDFQVMVTCCWKMCTWLKEELCNFLNSLTVLGLVLTIFFKGVTAVHTPVSLSLASCHSMMVSMPHFVPMTHLFTKIQLPSYLSGNQWFSFKLWVLLYRALQFHMQGRVGKCNTWTRLHDCLCIPSWWKQCPLLQPSLFSTNRIFLEFTSSQ